ncbi:MAG: hypothetical protein KatS3mg093_134 [Candidatus Parcubacteria bacterium]|nr:MAG: hypothetical protein KatS3mg093_134 [Candidatus Parcubacteria bacterium]
MVSLIRLTIYFIIILIIFAIIPKSFLDKIKKFFNWEIFWQTLKTGFNNFINFIKEATGLDFSKVPESLKKTFGLDIIAIWSSIKNFLANFFMKLSSIFR